MFAWLNDPSKQPIIQTRFWPIIAAVTILLFYSGSGRSHVWNEPLGWEGAKLRSHVRHPQSDVTDRKPAAAPAGRVRSIWDVQLPETLCALRFCLLFIKWCVFVVQFVMLKGSSMRQPAIRRPAPVTCSSPTSPLTCSTAWSRLGSSTGTQTL